VSGVQFGYIYIVSLLSIGPVFSQMKHFQPSNSACLVQVQID
jgi:hypothetical protein